MIHPIAQKGYISTTGPSPVIRREAWLRTLRLSQLSEPFEQRRDTSDLVGGAGDLLLAKNQAVRACLGADHAEWLLEGGLVGEPRITLPSITIPWHWLPREPPVARSERTWHVGSHDRWPDGTSA